MTSRPSLAAAFLAAVARREDAERAQEKRELCSDPDCPATAHLGEHHYRDEDECFTQWGNSADAMVWRADEAGTR